MKSAIFKLVSRADDIEGTAQFLAAADAIFARNDDGTPTEGCGWSEVRRVDEDHIEVWVQTLDSVMDMVCLDPRLELVQKLEGWPEPEPPAQDEMVI